MTGPGSAPYLVAPGSPKIKHHECNLRGGPWPFIEQDLGDEGKRKSIHMGQYIKKKPIFSTTMQELLVYIQLSNS